LSPSSENETLYPACRWIALQKRLGMTNWPLVEIVSTSPSRAPSLVLRAVALEDIIVEAIASAGPWSGTLHTGKDAAFASPTENSAI
jgi:hypothetical protein